jgi:hypothetical protein
MTKDEALKLALAALKESQTDNDTMEFWDRKTIAILKCEEALAQPEQEPLEYWNAVEGWVKIDEVRKHFDSVGCGTIYKTAGEGRAPLYTSPPKREWVGLTDEQALECAGHSVSDIARKAEAKLKELNT